MITWTDYPDALKEDTPYEFALGRYHGLIASISLANS